MNKIVATISQIHNVKNLNIVEFEFNKIKLKMMSLDLNENIKVGQKVILTIKPTNIAIAKDIKGSLSYSNQITTVVKNIERGNLLSIINANYENTKFQSTITSSSLERMELKDNDIVTLLFKASDLSILEVIND